MARIFCHIDPKYQKVGKLGIKSDVYSRKVMLLQIIITKSPMGLTHHVERATKRVTSIEMLGPEVPGWLVEKALKFACQYLAAHK